MKRLVLIVDGSDNDRASLQSADTIRRALNARLVVQFLRPQQMIVAGDGMMGTIAYDQSADIAVYLNSAKAAFEDVFPGDVQGVTFVDSEQHLIPALMTSDASAFDAVIIERVSSEEGPEVLLLNCALFNFQGPVIVVPPKPVERMGQRIAVAWNGQPQTLRAIRAGLDFLTKAETISVFTLAKGTGDRATLEDYFDAQGLTAEWHDYGGADMAARQRGRALLAAAEGVGADLLIVGAFGSNAFSRLFGLGRTTQKLVSSCKMSVLLHA